MVELLGATPAIYSDAYDYLRVYCSFSIFSNLTITLAMFAKCDGSPMLAMACHGIGSILNIVFDYIFIYIFNWGVMGAAIATQLGDLFGFIIILTHFLFKKGKLRFAAVKFKQLWSIIRTGTPELMVQLTDPVSVFVFNIAAVRLMGEMGLASYSVVSYVVTFVTTVFLGISQGIQPLISYSSGRQDKEAVAVYRRMGVKFGVAVSLLVYASFILFGKAVVGAFTTDAHLIDESVRAIRIYGLSMLIAPVNLVYIACYTAEGKTCSANIISALRGAVLIVVFVILMPVLLGPVGLWTAMIPVEACTYAAVRWSMVSSRKSKAGQSGKPHVSMNKCEDEALLQ